MGTAIIYDCGSDETSAVSVVMPLEDLRSAKKIAIKAKQAALFLAGYTHNFGGSAGIRTLDMRDADDKTNWTLLLIKCQGLIAAGLGSTAIRLRSQANDTFEVSASTGFTAMNAMLAWGESLYAAKWDLDEAVDAAADQAALDAIDIEAGWP